VQGRSDEGLIAFPQTESNQHLRSVVYPSDFRKYLNCFFSECSGLDLAIFSAWMIKNLFKISFS
jgi:hypothetical protein